MLEKSMKWNIVCYMRINDVIWKLLLYHIIEGLSQFLHHILLECFSNNKIANIRNL